MIALSTGSLYSRDISHAFALATEAGFEGVEVMIDARWDTRDADYLSGLSARHAIPIISLHSPFLDHIPGWPEDELERLRLTISLAVRLNVKVVTVHLPGMYPALEGKLRGSGRSRSFHLPIPWRIRTPFHRFLLNGLVDMELSSGVAVALENMPARRLLGRPMNYFWFNRPEDLKRFPHLTMDTTHLGTWGVDPSAFYTLLKKNISHVHLSNFDGREHRSPVHGEMNLSALLRLMGRDGFSGAVVVETDPEAVDARDEKRCLEALREVFRWCSENFSAGPSV